jgi:hypothetical protein
MRNCITIDGNKTFLMLSLSKYAAPLSPYSICPALTLEILLLCVWHDSAAADPGTRRGRGKCAPSLGAHDD